MSCQVQAPKHLQTRCLPRLSIEYLRQKRKKKGQHRLFSFIVLATFGPNLADSVNSIFKRQRPFSVLIYSHLNTKGSWEDSRKLCKRETQLRVCIAKESIQKNSWQFVLLVYFLWRTYPRFRIKREWTNSLLPACKM